MGMYSQLPINEAMTRLVNEPGVTIVDYPDDEDLHGIYIPTFPVVCPKHNAICRKNDFTPETIYGLIDDDGDAYPVTIHIERQRYKCPYCKGEISYNPDYGKKGCTTTNKLNAYIGRQCLDCSPKTVADELGGIVSKNTVSNIFKAWSDNCLEHYESAMIAPENIGIHCIKVFKNIYFLVSDLQNKNILDVFSWDTITPISLLLMKLASTKRTIKVLSDIEPGCIVPSKGAFGATADVSVSASSVYRVSSEDLCEALENNCAIREKNYLKDWVSTPLLEESTIDKFVLVKVLNRLNDKSEEQRAWLSNHERLKNHVIPKWSPKMYFPWKEDISKYSAFSHLCTLLEIESEEINSSFADAVLQQNYSDLDWKAQQLLTRCQKCSFEILRKRLLLSFNPKLSTVPGMAKRYHTGISVDELFMRLPEYRA